MKWRILFAAMITLLSGEPVHGADLSGIVTDAQGAPLSGARVFIHSAGPKTGTTPFCPTCYADCNRSAASDAAGRFTIASVAPSLRFTLLAVGQDRKPKFAARVDPDAGPVTIALEARNTSGIPPQRLLRGRILGSNGAPVIGATISPYALRFGSSREGGRLEKIDPLSVSDDNGEFQLVAEETHGFAGVVVESAGWARAVFPELAADGQPHNLTVRRGAFVQAKLLDPQGRGLAGIKMGLTPTREAENGSEIGSFDAETNAEGICIFANVPADLPCELFARSESLGAKGLAIPARAVRTGADETTTDAGTLSAVTAHALHGQVTLSDGHSVPAGTRVVVWRPPNDSQIVNLDAQGEFTANGLAGQRLSVSVRVPGYKVSWKNKDVDELNDTVYAQLREGTQEKKIVLDPEETTAAAGAPEAPAGPLTGIALQPDGQPAAGLMIAAATLKNTVIVGNGKIELYIGLSGKPPLSTKTDAAGRFALPRPPSPATLVAAGPQGYAEIALDPTATVQTITLNPWAHIEGTARVGAEAVAGESIEAIYIARRFRYPLAPHVRFESRAKTDEAGRYQFDLIPAGIITIGRHTEIDNFWGTRAQSISIETKARETTHADLGGSGRAITGKVEIPPATLQEIDWKGVSGELRLKQPATQPPEGLSDDEKTAWFAAWSNSDAGRQAQLAERSYSFGIQQDGTFRIEDVAPGTYLLHARFRRKNVERYDVVGYLGAEIDLPAGETPFPVPPLPLMVQEKGFVAGDVAPALEINALDGTPIPPTSLAGKVLLLHFWMAGSHTLEEEIKPLRDLQQTFGHDERFAIVSLAMNDKREALDRFLEKNPLPWRQTYLGPMDKSPVAKAFRARGFPSVFLIGTDGKFIETVAHLDHLKAKIAKALER